MPANHHCVLLVEGKTEDDVIYQLRKYAQIPIDAFHVQVADGADKLLRSLRPQLKAPDLEKLGIVIDADTAIDQRWSAIMTQLRLSGYKTISTTPQLGGTIIRESEKPVIGVWVMPNNQLPGILENFIEFLIPQPDNLWDRAKICVDQIPADKRRFKESYLQKAYIHTWLAWQEEPGTPIGHAVTKRYLNPDATTAQEFLNWLMLLFDLKPEPEPK